MRLLVKAGILLLVAFFVSTTCYLEEISAKQTSKQVNSNRLSNDMKDALDQVKILIPELKNLDLLRTEIHDSNIFNPDLWVFLLHSGNSRSWVTIDANTKQLYEYVIVNGDWNSSIQPSEKFAAQKAEEFLHTVYGDFAENYRLKEVNIPKKGDSNYQKGIVYAEFDLYINNIIVRNFGLSVLVDGEGHITGVSNGAIESPIVDHFPKPKKVISVNKAKTSIIKLLRMSTAYDLAEYGEPVQNKIVYEPNFEGAIDAFTGKLSNEMKYTIKEKPEKIKVNGKGNELVANTTEEAAALVENEFGISLDNLDFVGEDDGFYYRCYNWKSKNTKNENDTVELCFFQKTGEFAFYNYMTSFPYLKDPPVSFQEAKKIATSAVEKYLPKDRKEIFLSVSSDQIKQTQEPPDWVQDPEQYEIPDEDINTYYFAFNDIYQGLKTNQSEYLVDIDPKTGKVVRFESDKVDDFSSYPDKGKLISSSKATNTYLKYNPFVLSYVWPTYHDQKSSAPVLLYVLDPRDKAVIDAVTGEYIKYGENLD